MIRRISETVNIQGGEISLSSCSFVSNSTSSVGGGIAVAEQGKRMATGSHVERNVAFEKGGTVNIQGGETSMSSSSFVSNRANSVGKAVAVAEQGKLMATNSRFERNVAFETGGAVSIHDSDLSLAAKTRATEGVNPPGKEDALASRVPPEFTAGNGWRPGSVRLAERPVIL